jgi:hypothetical protein
VKTPTIYVPLSDMREGMWSFGGVLSLGASHEGLASQYRDVAWAVTEIEEWLSSMCPVHDRQVGHVSRSCDFDGNSFGLGYILAALATRVPLSYRGEAVFTQVHVWATGEFSAARQSITKVNIDEFDAKLEGFLAANGPRILFVPEGNVIVSERLRKQYPSHVGIEQSPPGIFRRLSRDSLYLERPTIVTIRDDPTSLRELIKALFLPEATMTRVTKGLPAASTVTAVTYILALFSIGAAVERISPLKSPFIGPGVGLICFLVLATQHDTLPEKEEPRRRPRVSTLEQVLPASSVATLALLWPAGKGLLRRSFMLTLALVVALGAMVFSPPSWIPVVAGFVACYLVVQLLDATDLLIGRLSNSYLTPTAFEQHHKAERAGNYVRKFAITQICSGLLLSSICRARWMGIVMVAVSSVLITRRIDVEGTLRPFSNSDRVVSFGVLLVVVCAALGAVAVYEHIRQPFVYDEWPIWAFTSIAIALAALFRVSDLQSEFALLFARERLLARQYPGSGARLLKRYKGIPDPEGIETQTSWLGLKLCYPHREVAAPPPDKAAFLRA